MSDQFLTRTAAALGTEANTSHTDMSFQGPAQYTSVGSIIIWTAIVAVAVAVCAFWVMQRRMGRRKSQ